VNCAALPESIAESELFGHVAGAFTGATRDRAGKFEIADGGTLFLDEIGELPLTVQPKLLRVLQQGEIQRIGSDRVHRVNVRVIAATNRNLEHEVERGRFRATRFTGCPVFPLYVPHSAKGARTFWCWPRTSWTLHDAGSGQAWCVSHRKLTSCFQRRMARHIRELDNVVSRAVLRASFGRSSDETIMVGVDHLDLSGTRPQSSVLPSTGWLVSPFPSPAS
jgi:anaerobic nitric oxide reductase transcription regulator